MNKPLLLLGLLASFSAIAQTYQLTDKEKEKHLKEVAKSKEKNDILWDYDTVYNAGVPICIVYKVDKGALVHDDYSVRSLTGQELIYVKYGTYTDYTAPRQPNTAPPTYGYYSYLFLNDKRTAETLTNRVYKEVGRNDLIMNGNQVNPDAEAKFILSNPPKYSLIQPPVVVAGPPTIQYVMVNRDRNGAISIIGNQVNQAGLEIGVLQYGEATVNGVHMKTISVFLQDMHQVAVASAQDNQPHVWTIVTTRDNMRGTITSAGDDNMDVVKYLIYGNYL